MKATDEQIIETLKDELASAKAGYERLNKLWHEIHELGMETIREAVGLPAEYPGGRVQAICERIAKLKRLEAAVRRLREDQKKMRIHTQETIHNYERVDAALSDLD